MVPRILAFDQSLNFAYAACRPNGGAPITALNRLPCDGEDYGRAFEFGRRVVMDAISVHKPDEVWLESPLLIRGDNANTTMQTVRILFGLCAVIELAAREAGLPCFEVNNMTWKKFFVGNGRAQKRDTIARCIQCGWGKLDNNCADAAGIWSYARACSDDDFAVSLPPIEGALV